MFERRRWTEDKFYSEVTKLLSNRGKTMQELTASDIRNAGLYYPLVKLFNNLSTLKKKYQVPFDPDSSSEAFEKQVVERPDYERSLFGKHFAKSDRLIISKLKILEINDSADISKVMEEVDLRNTASRYACKKTEEYISNTNSWLNSSETKNKFIEFKEAFLGELTTSAQRVKDVRRKRETVIEYASKLVKFREKRGRFPTGTELNSDFQYLYKLMRKNNLVLKELFSSIEEIYLTDKRLINSTKRTYIGDWSDYIDCLRNRYTHKLCNATTFKDRDTSWPCNKRRRVPRCLLANKNN